MDEDIKRHKHHDDSDHEDRDGPLFFWVIVKLAFIAAVLWYATPHPMQ